MPADGEELTRILIAGLGSIGRRHLRNLATLGESDIVLLRTHRATLPEDELAGYPVETDLREALRQHRPAAVIVSNPTAAHLGVAIPAAETGCAILLEKPISDSMKGLDQLQAAVQRSGSKVLVGFQFRFHPALLHIRKIISDGVLGRIISARVEFGEYLPGWHPWEDYRQSYAARPELGGGVLLTQCHALDYLPWLLGKVQDVWGFLGCLSDLELEVEDTAEIGLRMVGGGVASIHLDYVQRPPAHRLDIVGTRGVLRWDASDGATRLYSRESDEWKTNPLPAGWERNTMFVDEMQHFLAVIRGEVGPACTLDDGLRAMKLIAAVQTSDRSRRLVSPEG